MSMVLHATLLQHLRTLRPGSGRAAPLCRAPRIHAARARGQWMPPLLLLLCGLLLQPAAADSAAMSSKQHAYHATPVTHHVLSTSSSSSSSSSRGVVDAMHMGVSYCKLYLNTSAFENELGGSYQPSQFVLHVFLRWARARSQHMLQPHELACHQCWRLKAMEGGHLLQSACQHGLFRSASRQRC